MLPTDENTEDNNDREVRALIDRGRAYAGLHHFEKAIQDYGGAIRLNPHYAEDYAVRGITYYSLGQYEQAIQNFDEAIRLEPKNAEAYLGRGHAYAALDQHEQAIQDFGRAKKIGFTP